jgi:carbon-monoxide dehydrogenase large subunit
MGYPRARPRATSARVALVAPSRRRRQDARGADRDRVPGAAGGRRCREALAPEPLLHEGIPGNLCFDYEYGNEKVAEDALAGATHITRLTLDSTRVSGTPMEPKACVASWDAASESFDIYAASQGKGMMVPSLGAILGMPAEKIRLHALDVGGGFGIRSDAYAEYVALMVASRKLGRGGWDRASRPSSATTWRREAVGKALDATAARRLRVN